MQYETGTIVLGFACVLISLGLTLAASKQVSKIYKSHPPNWSKPALLAVFLLSSAATTMIFSFFL